MSIVAVSGVPISWSIAALGSVLSKTTEERYDEFEVLNYEPKGDRTKTGYVRTSENLDPLRVVEQFNAKSNILSLKAYIPEYIPDFPLASKKTGSKKKNMPENNPEFILPLTHREILNEIQSKFSGLYNLSKKTGHKLLRELATMIFKRLTGITSMNRKAAGNCITLSKCYRKKYPHFGDFQFILSTLHALQDASGAPRAQISEQQLVSVQHHPYMYEDIPYDKIQTACKQYSEIISKTVNEHIKNLNTEVDVADSEEEVARKKVRTELKKLTPFMQSVLQQITTKHFIPMKPPYLRIWMYGEPFLPPREVMLHFLKRHSAGYQRRSSWIFNLLKFNIPPDQYSGLIAMEGTIINGAKLVIRNGYTPKYKVPCDLLQKWLGKSVATEFSKLNDNADDEDEDEMNDQMEE